MLEYIILGFLMSRAASGYDLKQCMAESTSYFFDASYGSIYPALKRLEEKKLILSEEKVSGGKFKKLYSITEEGRDCFLAWLRQPVRFVRTRLDYLVPLFFYEYLDPVTAKQNLTQFMETASAGLEELRSERKDLEGRNMAASHTFHGSVLVYGIRYYEMLIDWCSELAVRTDGRSSRPFGNTVPPEDSQLSVNTENGGTHYENNHPRL